MADYDSEACLNLLVETLGLPVTRTVPTDPQLYVMLTNAQKRMVHLFAAHAPQTLYGPSEKLQTTDGGYTYTFAYYPFGHAEIRESRSGAILYPVPEWGNDANGYVMEGQTIRWPDGSARTFADGPYARYAKVAGQVTATTQPSLPDDFRPAMIYDAAREWATQGGNQDPTPYKDLLQSFLWGDPNTPGHVGLIPALKTQVNFQGARSIGPPKWYQGNGWINGG